MRKVYTLDEKEIQSAGVFVKYFSTSRRPDVSIYLPLTEFGGASNLPQLVTVIVEARD
jgi:hypothetical protein